MNKLLSAGHRDTEGTQPEFRHCHNEQAVFLDEIQLRQDVKHVILQSIARRIRLQLLDFSQDRDADKWLDSLPHSIRELLWGEADREQSLNSFEYPNIFMPSGETAYSSFTTSMWRKLSVSTSTSTIS
jgi:hypothetical protein